MNVRILCVLAGLLGCVITVAEAQINCPANSTVRQPLVCLLPDASATYDPNGSVANTALQATTLPINGAIGVQLTQLPIPSASSGTIGLKEAGNPVPRPFDNLGSVLVDVPGSVGKGHLYSSFSYQRFNFNAISGIGLGKVTFGYSGVPDGANTDYGSSDNAVTLKLDQYAVVFTYGATKTTDISVNLPFNSVSATSQASNINTYKCPITGGPCLGTGQIAKPQFVSGSASGIGDVNFTVRQLVIGGDGQSWALTLGGGVRLPTGDPYNYLGSGAYGANVFGLVSYRSQSLFSPHFKLGDQWNGPSPLVNTNASGNVNLPGGISYAIGTDARVRRNLTLSVDILGSQFVNSPTLKSSNIALPANSGSLTGVDLLVNSTYTTANLSSGLKYKPYPGLLFYASVFVPLRDVGLRSDPVPLVGLSYNWGPK